MRAPATRAISNVITALAISVVFLIMVMLLAQNRQLSEDIKAQTTINQRYLRCILLLPREAYANLETRVEAIDRCTEESRLPSGERLGE